MATELTAEDIVTAIKELKAKCEGFQANGNLLEEKIKHEMSSMSGLIKELHQSSQSVETRLGTYEKDVQTRILVMESRIATTELAS